MLEKLYQLVDLLYSIIMIMYIERVILGYSISQSTSRVIWLHINIVFATNVF